MKYLVTGYGGPGFESAEQAKELLTSVVHPSFDRLIALEKEGKIFGGGLPVGDRAVVFVLEAASHDEADTIIQGLPIWSLLEWDVTPLQDFAGRKAQEMKFLG